MNSGKDDSEKKAGACCLSADLSAVPSSPLFGFRNKGRQLQLVGQPSVFSVLGYYPRAAVSRRADSHA